MDETGEAGLQCCTERGTDERPRGAHFDAMIDIGAMGDDTTCKENGGGGQKDAGIGWYHCKADGI